MIRWLQNTIDQGFKSDPDGLNSWRIQVFKIILLLIVLFGIVPYGFSVYLAIYQKAYPILVFNSLVYISTIYVVLTKRIPIMYRVYIVVALFLVLGIGLILILGEEGLGGGFSYLIAFSVTCALLLGIKGAINSLVILFLFIVSVSLGLHFNVFYGLAIAEFGVVKWLTLSTNMIAVSSLSSVSLAILVRGLESTIGKQKLMQAQLEDKVEQLKKAKSKAEEADQLKTKFLANMSHEIRTPLNSIMGFSELVINDLFDDDAERKEYLCTINQSGSYLLNIIENVLDFSMIESKQMKHSILPTGLNKLLSDIKNIYQLHNLSKPKVSVIIELDISNELTVNSDGDRLKQVFINLINNSLKFTYEGTISAGYQVYENEVVCFVKDTGIGISTDNLNRVFERFVKIEGEHQTQKHGTGLGLPICKGIIETLGGNMWVESEVGVGSSFYFTIPVSK